MKIAQLFDPCGFVPLAIFVAQGVKGRAVIEVGEVCQLVIDDVLSQVVWQQKYEGRYRDDTPSGAVPQYALSATYAHAFQFKSQQRCLLVDHLSQGGSVMCCECANDKSHHALPEGCACQVVGVEREDNTVTLLARPHTTTTQARVGFQGESSFDNINALAVVQEAACVARGRPVQQPFQCRAMLVYQPLQILDIARVIVRNCDRNGAVFASK